MRARLQAAPRRNVEVFDSGGAVVAGFWQYGSLQWDEFYQRLRTFIVTSTDWSIFQYEPTQRQHGAPCPSGASIVQEGTYILLSTAGEPIRVGLASLPSPSYHPGPIPHSDSIDPFYYQIRAWKRDGKCLITDSDHLKTSVVVHIFPPSHYAEWVRKGYPNKISDTSYEAACTSGSFKIDSVQNLLTLCINFGILWELNMIGVEPEKGYRITEFYHCNSSGVINGRHLHLDHIQDPTLRPLDELFTDHFKRCIFRHIRGTGRPDPEWMQGCYDSENEVRLIDLLDQRVEPGND